MLVRNIPVSRLPSGLVTYAVSFQNESVKIGRTGNLRRRLAAIQTYVPAPLDLWGWKYGDFEAEIHERLRSERIHGEWFHTYAETAIALLDYELVNECE